MLTLLTLLTCVYVDDIFYAIVAFKKAIYNNKAVKNPVIHNILRTNIYC